jgi:RNA 2',3'-cyclic 3'-phosphodiesterase
MSAPASVRQDERLRLFLALQLPEDVVAALDAWASEQLDQTSVESARRVPREHLHVTLAFLGGRPADELPAVLGALGAAVRRSAPFPLEPVRYRETRSVGMVVLDDPTGAAGALAADLHDRLERLRVYRREARPWLPHVTVLRFRERPRLHPPPPGVGTFVPSGAAAFLSCLHPTGARYEVLESVGLGG